MKPVSDYAYYSHLKAYLDEMHSFMPKNISSATCSAVAIFQIDCDPENIDEDNFDDDIKNFMDYLESMYDWIVLKEGLFDYLYEQFESFKDLDEDSWLFYIGDTYDSRYGSYKEFKSDLDINLIYTIFKKCWERSGGNEYPKGRQLLKDFPKLKTDFSNYKKLIGDELLNKIEEDILANYEKIKSYGYISTNKNNDDIALVEEFFLEHTKALESKKNSGIEIPNYKFPAVWKIGKLTKGKYLIGDLGEAIRYGNKKLVDEFKLFENQTDTPDDEFYLSPPNFEEFLIKQKNIDPKDNILKISPDSQFIMIAPGIDESNFSDDNGGSFFQSSNCVICLKVNENFFNKEGNLKCYQFLNDFECSYYSDYDILKLGNFHVYSHY